MLRFAISLCAALFLFAGSVQQSSARDMRYFSPNSIHNRVPVPRWQYRPQQRRLRVPQALGDAGRRIGTFAGRQYLGGKVKRYAPRAGRVIQGSPWGAAGTMLLWPNVAQ